MSGANDALAAAVAEVQTLLAARGVSAHLVGGLAVHFHLEEIRRVHASSLASLAPTDRIRLACLVRATRDIDIIVVAKDVIQAEDALRDAGFRRAENEPPPRRWLRAGTGVDVIACGGASELERILDVIQRRSARRRPMLEGPVVHPAHVVILKALAYASSSARDGDLVDVARLALADRWRADDLRNGLSALGSSLDPRLRACLHEFREHFSTPARKGPAAFVTQFGAELPAESVDEIRALVAAVTYDVLEAGLVE